MSSYEYDDLQCIPIAVRTYFLLLHISAGYILLVRYVCESGCGLCVCVCVCARVYMCVCVREREISMCVRIL